MIKNSFKENMVQRILSGALRPGERLPSERELAEEFGISRGSVNQGILDLERVGFLKVVPRQGTFVADYLENATALTMAEIINYDSARIDAKLFRDLGDMRILIERESVRLACGRITKTDVDTLSELTARIYSAEGEELTAALYAYHRELVRLGGNRVYLMTFHSFEYVLLNNISLHYKDPEQRRLCLPLYDKLSAAIVRRDTEQADELINSILTVACDYVYNALAGSSAK